MKNRLFYILLFGAAALAAACDRDDEVTEPSNADVDWFAIADSNDEIDHLRYQIYEDTGASIYYNDTIGSQDRGVDGWGNPYTYYEVLDVNYNIESTSLIQASKYMLTKDRKGVKEALEMLRDIVIPDIVSLKKGSGVNIPRSILLVDSIVLHANHSTVQGCILGHTVKSMMTLCVGQLNDFPTMTPQERRHMAGYIFAELYGEKLQRFVTDNMPEKYREFVAASNKTTGEDIHGWCVRFYSASVGHYLFNGGGTNFTTFRRTATPWEDYGFLYYNTNNIVCYNPCVYSSSNSVEDYASYAGTYEAVKSYNCFFNGEDRTNIYAYNLPLENLDVYEYLAAVYVGDDAWFEETYVSKASETANYQMPRSGREIMRQKYAIMKELLAEFKAQMKK